MHSIPMQCLVVQSRAMQGSFILTKLRCIVLRSFASLGGVRLCVVRYGMARFLYYQGTRALCCNALQAVVFLGKVRRCFRYFNFKICDVRVGRLARGESFRKQNQK